MNDGDRFRKTRDPDALLRAARREAGINATMRRIRETLDTSGFIDQWVERVPALRQIHRRSLLVLDDRDESMESVFLLLAYVGDYFARPLVARLAGQPLDERSLERAIVLPPTNGDGAATLLSEVMAMVEDLAARQNRTLNNAITTEFFEALFDYSPSPEMDRVVIAYCGPCTRKLLPPALRRQISNVADSESQPASSRMSHSKVERPPAT